MRETRKGERRSCGTWEDYCTLQMNYLHRKLKQQQRNKSRRVIACQCGYGVGHSTWKVEVMSLTGRKKNMCATVVLGVTLYDLPNYLLYCAVVDIPTYITR